MPGLDNKISNVIATRLPQWLVEQLNERVKQNTQSSRDNANLLYLANKTGWIRVVSSVSIAPDVVKDSTQNDRKGDMGYFKDLTGINLKDENDLAKNYVLYGGTSIYNKPDANKDEFTYNLRGGLKSAYNVANVDEIQKYGYRPMPGITDAKIETMGRLGSVRLAEINFKVWDKSQLDIIDALYFKLGYSVFIEWGHTYYYDSKHHRLNTTETYCIDPFKEGLTKDKINAQIYQNMRNSEGNYEGMLGIISNYNFSLNQEGGYDCSIKVVGLGALGDSIKINQQGNFPDIVIKEFKSYVNNLKRFDEATAKKAFEESERARISEQIKNLKSNFSIRGSIDDELRKPSYAGETVDSYITKHGYISADFEIGNTVPSFTKNTVEYGDIIDELTSFNKFIIRKKSSAIPINDIDDTRKYIDNITLKESTVNDIFARAKETNLSYTGNVYASNQSYNPKGYSYYTKATYPNPYTPEIYNPASKNSVSLNYTSVISFGIKDNTISNIPTPNIPIIGATTVAPLVISLLANTTADDVSLKLSQGNQDVKANILEAIRQDLIDNKQLPSTKILSANKVISDDLNTLKTSSNEVVEIIVEGVLKVSNAYDIEYTVAFYESSFIETIAYKAVSESDQVSLVYSDYIDNALNQSQSPLPENTSEVSSVDDNQIRNALAYQSILELALKAIQLHSLSKTYTNKDLAEKAVNIIHLTDDLKFYKQIFSVGIFSSFIEDLIKDNIDSTKYPNSSAIDTLKVQARYGFNSSVMIMNPKCGNTATEDVDDLDTIPRVDYKSLSTTYVIPYDINQEILTGTVMHHPVYIKFGFLLMLLNNMCTIYDTKKDSTSNKDQTPLIYIDFNPGTNFCLSRPEQLSVDVQNFLIPFQGTKADYQKLFNPDIIDKGNNTINPVSGSTEPISLFNPSEDNRISGYLPPFKFDTKEDYKLISNDNVSGYRGHVMNVLINIEYILETIKSFAAQDGTSAVYLRSFIEKVLSDMNKSLGNFNIFRLSYNDASNTFVITDDQYVPGISGEQIDRAVDKNYDIPIFGKDAIAKTLELRSEVSSKLSSMIAISSNADAKYGISNDATSYGFINTNYVDRYINNKTGIQSALKDNKSQFDSLKNTAAKFNTVITSAYKTDTPSKDSIDLAINYYIERMNKIKGESVDTKEGAKYPTRAAALIPLSLNMSTDGISGFRIGNAFTVSDKFLPYTYTARQAADSNATNKVGFCVVGVTHTIANNVWDTSLRSHMIYLKNQYDFTGAELNVNYNKQGVTQISGLSGIALLSDLDFRNALKAMCTRLNCKEADMLNVMWAESKLNPIAENPETKAYGLIQFTTASGINRSEIPSDAIGQLPLVEKYFKNIDISDIYKLYAYTFLPVAYYRLENNSFILESSKLSASTISKQNPAIATAAGKTPGLPLTVGDFKKYVDNLSKIA